MTAPLTFEPLFMERVWGGRRLAELYGKALPAGAIIGESWELVDRPEAQSVVASGPFARTPVGDLWRSEDRVRLFGARAADAGERLPILVKLLDCVDTLSVQVHPSPDVAPELDGEPKTEMWVVLDASPDSFLLVGLRDGVTRARFEATLTAGEDVSRLLQRVEVGVGDAMFLPAGRVHAIGGGCVIAEVQQNSDTTYRVFDFDRPGLDGAPRELHVEESLRAIDFADREPELLQPHDGVLVRDEHFEVDRFELSGRPRPAAPAGEAAVVMVTQGRVALGGVVHRAGTTVLVPADAGSAGVLGGDGEVLRILLGA